MGDLIRFNAHEWLLHALRFPALSDRRP